MALKRMDNVLIVVEDLETVKCALQPTSHWRHVVGNAGSFSVAPDLLVGGDFGGKWSLFTPSSSTPTALASCRYETLSVWILSKS